MSDIIFYFGSTIIVSLFIYLSIIKFKDYKEIDLKEHKWIIITYILLLVLAIIAWRVIFLIIEVNFYQSLKYEKTIEDIING